MLSTILAYRLDGENRKGLGPQSLEPIQKVSGAHFPSRKYPRQSRSLGNSIKCKDLLEDLGLA